MSDLAWSIASVGGALALGVNIAGLLGWVERKQSAVMQDRIGANRASIFGIRIWGLFHPLADALKMITKEDFIPPRAHRPWFTLAPGISLAMSLLCLAALPYGDFVTIGEKSYSLQPLPLSAGVVFVLALLSVGVHGIVMAGYSSGSIYGLLGGLRGAAQMISYEVAMLSTLAAPLFVYGTLDLAECVRAQAWSFGFGLPGWGIFTQPLAFVLFLTAGAAETKRAPFDLPEGEAEIVGYFVEYSGTKFLMFMMNDFIETIVLAGLITAIFLGGWHVPGLAAAGIGLEAKAVIGVAAFLFKMMAVIWLLMQIRWTLPRFRFDQLLDLGWKNLLPLSLANFLVTAWAVYLWRAA